VSLAFRTVSVATLAGAMVAACSLDTVGLLGIVDGGPRDATLTDTLGHGEDAPGDVRPNDAPSAMDVDPPDADASAEDAGDASLDDGEAGIDVTYKCPGTKGVTDCSSCKHNPIGCVYCDGGAYVGVCIGGGQHCADHIPSHTEMCPCDDDAAACPLPHQVCIENHGCGTCGQGNSNGLTCRNGGTCDEKDADCE
jgi:hypothetical protein